MALHVKAENVPERKRVQSGPTGEGSMVVKKAYGNESSLMIAVRASGYHTKPHVHESEQINYVLDGEIWFFVEDKGFHCKKGDFQRVPANKIHWAWNRSDADAIVAEAHAPALIGGKSSEGAVALFDEGEAQQITGPGENKFVPYDSAKTEKQYSAR
ncbi:MAG: cupin domain-containing protein [Candidatus Binatia bacterium]